MTIEKLPKSVQSSDQLQLSIDELDEFAKTLVRTNRQSQAGGKTNISLPELSESSLALLNVLPEEQHNDFEKVGQLVNELREISRVAPVVHFTTSGLASSGLKADITSWFRVNISPFLLVAFHVNPDIAGGMLLRTMNQVYDFSFRTQLLVQSSKIVKVIENV